MMNATAPVSTPPAARSVAAPWNVFVSIMVIAYPLARSSVDNSAVGVFFFPRTGEISGYHGPLPSKRESPHKRHRVNPDIPGACGRRTTKGLGHGARTVRRTVSARNAGGHPGALALRGRGARGGPAAPQ